MSLYRTRPGKKEKREKRERVGCLGGDTICMLVRVKAFTASFNVTAVRIGTAHRSFSFTGYSAIANNAFEGMTIGIHLSSAIV